jgi:hypothetical protein
MSKPKTGGFFRRCGDRTTRRQNARNCAIVAPSERRGDGTIMRSTG